MRGMQLPVLVRYLSQSSVLLPLFAGMISWRLLQGNVRFVFWAVVASFVADSVSELLVHFKMNNWPAGNIFLIVHFTLLFAAFDGQKSVPLKIFFSACVVFSLLDFFFIETPMKMNSYTAYVTGILLIVMALNYLYQLMNSLPVENITTLPLFWLAFATLVYYGGTLFIFLFNNYLTVHLPQIRSNLWIVHNVSNILKNVLFFAAIWINYKSKTSPL